MSSSPVVSKSAAGAVATKAPASRAWIFITALAIAVAILLAIVLSQWLMASAGIPRLNEDTVTLAKFVSTDAFAKLPFDKQHLYMKVLEDREDNEELKKAYDAGRLTESEYRTALQEAWLGEQLKRSEKYAALPPGPMRTLYITELLDKKQRKKAQESKAPKRTASATAGKAGTEIKRDDTLEKMRIASWPAHVRMQWEEFRRAYDTQKEAREKAAQEKAAAAAPASESSPQ